MKHSSRRLKVVVSFNFTDQAGGTKRQHADLDYKSEGQCNSSGYKETH